MDNEPKPENRWMLTVTCRGCGGRIRFPVNKGKIRVRCPWCQSWFIFSWHPFHLWDMAKRMAAPLFGKRLFSSSGPASAAPARQVSIKTKMVVLFLAALAMVLIMNICNPNPPVAP